MCHRAENSMRAAGDGAIGIDECDGAAEVPFRDLWNAAASFLIGHVADSIPRRLLPAVYGDAADAALAVEEH
jgi:hypothetical protein